ncbi:hypothetical protein AIOL_003588 [Candidatus Rhodobacter oscarellae]|uniref:Uncharacterized protein n=1 Tax=Candidatus Rhodobacter oscarellae TaxID=1675527 RepID=A0A0J9E786_9RHOB|nr:hypothetical protein [Candidatus Rhodobacter lobularis]KMW58610.1 hypothetical protein AIOL_003588 [Candidatus Rhodobacter lobularis]
MIRFVLRWLRRVIFGLVLLVLLLLAPVGYNELACSGEPVADSYQPIVSDPDWHRAEARSFLTYPEWHIVHAYDDYARVIRDGDPHQFGYVQAVRGFWGSLCALTEVSARHGGFDWVTKQTIYTIGVSFTLELGLKAAYEETLGRIATLIRGQKRAPLDDLSAKQAADYAAFLQQVPWYRWDFAGDVAALKSANTGSWRDTERRVALGLEFRAKAGYAKVIAAAVASAGFDALRLRMVVTGMDAAALEALGEVAVIEQTAAHIVIETPRYRELTHLLTEMADQGAEFIEIAGNDDIMLTAIAPRGAEHGALFAFDRQGYGDTRHLISMKVSALNDWLRAARDPSGGLTLEHIHDY